MLVNLEKSTLRVRLLRPEFVVVVKQSHILKKKQF
jgi:hypothetical protein